MQISHRDALTLENIVRNVFACNRGGMGGFIDADHFEYAPFDAALIALALLWKNDATADDEIADFLFKWESIFRGNENTEAHFSSYISEFENLIKKLQS